MTHVIAASDFCQRLTGRTSRDCLVSLMSGQLRFAAKARSFRFRPAAHERVNGPNHPWTKDSAGVTADALAALGRAEEAKALREKYGIEDQAV